MKSQVYVLKDITGTIYKVVAIDESSARAYVMSKKYGEKSKDVTPNLGSTWLGLGLDLVSVGPHVPSRMNKS
jgi:hypothetical protein